MKILRYILLPVLFLTTSCYIYRPYAEKEEKSGGNATVSPAAGSLSLMDSNEKTRQKSTLNPEAAREQDEKEKMKQQKKQEQQEAEKQKRESAGKSDENGRVSPNMELSSSKNTNLDGGRNKGRQDINSSDSSEPKIVEKGIKGKLEPSKFYKITARDKQFKIQVDKWDGDSLVAHIIRKPEKQIKLHKDEINEELILERRFSRPFSDLFTVGAYAAGAAAVLLIVL